MNDCSLKIIRIALNKTEEGIQLVKADCLICFQCLEACSGKGMRYQVGVDKGKGIS